MVQHQADVLGHFPPAISGPVDLVEKKEADLCDR